MSASLIQGLVIRQQAGFYTVFAENREITCKLRGKVKKEKINEDLIAIGDQVFISIITPDEGVIEEILPRQKEFFRLAPSARGEYKQILIANPDKVLLVFACSEPEPSLRMLDRFLVITEKQKIPAVIVANKVDLIGEQRAHNIFEVYSGLGYKVIYTSVKERINLDLLKQELVGRISAFSGPSGLVNPAC
jgi:ribosome biogenesis GTPase